MYKVVTNCLTKNDFCRHTEDMVYIYAIMLLKMVAALCMCSLFLSLSISLSILRIAHSSFPFVHEDVNQHYSVTSLPLLAIRKKAQSLMGHLLAFLLCLCVFGLRYVKLCWFDFRDWFCSCFSCDNAVTVLYMLASWSLIISFWIPLGIEKFRCHVTYISLHTEDSTV